MDDLFDVSNVMVSDLDESLGMDFVAAMSYYEPWALVLMDLFVFCVCVATITYISTFKVIIFFTKQLLVFSSPDEVLPILRGNTTDSVA